jgi:hypothetical protein
MEHDEKMASIRLKRHKYDLRYGPGSTPQTPGSSTAVLATAAATKEDKQIEILRLQIRLAELTRDNSAHASSSHASSSHASSSKMPHNSLRLEEVSTPSSGMSSLSYPSSFVDNNFMASEEPVGRYHVPDGEASNWQDTYNFS